jgi:hypothetical protein
MIAKSIEISQQVAAANSVLLANALRNVLDGQSVEAALAAAQARALETAPSFFAVGERCVQPTDVPALDMEQAKEFVASSPAARATGRELSATLREGIVKAVEAGALKVAPPSVAQVLRQYR